VFELFDDRTTARQAELASFAFLVQFLFLDARMPVRQGIEMPDHLPEGIG